MKLIVSIFLLLQFIVAEVRADSCSDDLVRAKFSSVQAQSLCSSFFQQDGDILIHSPYLSTNTAVGEDTQNRGVAQSPTDLHFSNPTTTITPVFTGGYNTSLGHRSLRMLNYGSDNTAVGGNALEFNVYSFYNSAVGHSALRYTTSGWRNSALGAFCLEDNVSGSQNVAMGYYAAGANVSGNFNTAIGTTAMAYGNNDYTTAVGTSALGNANGSTGNVAVGAGSFFDVSTGSNNSVLGNQSGYGLQTGSGNTIVGAGVTGLAAGLTNNIILANGTGAIKAQHNGTSWSFNGGATGTFTTADAKTVTVTGGLITAITP